MEDTKMANHRRENRLHVELLGLRGRLTNGMDLDSIPFLISDISPSGLGILIASKTPAWGKISLSVGVRNKFSHFGEVCWVREEGKNRYRIGVSMDLKTLCDGYYRSLVAQAV